MQFRVERADERPIYVQIVDEIRSSIMLGLLQPGDRLPSVRKLAAELEINLHTVRHAYSVLAKQKVVAVRRGAGTIVLGSLTHQPVLDRDRMLRDIAARALRSANRHGFSADEICSAIRRVDAALTPASWAPPKEPQEPMFRETADTE
jgi:GntR family transcriptional regulator